MSREHPTSASRGASEAKPYPKAQQLARGERRYRRKVASPKQWQAIFAAKGRACRLATPVCAGGIQYHHLVPRDLYGDDTADNIVPLCEWHHMRVTDRDALPCKHLARSLTDAEYAYVIGKLGEGALKRLFGA